MLKDSIRIVYFKHLENLIARGTTLGKVEPFDDDYYKELSNTLFNTIPVNLDIKYLKPTLAPGKCYDRSLKMFMAMENSILVRGSLNYFRVKGDTEEYNHGWVERDGIVYDPTWMSKFDKKLYYQIFKVKRVEKCTKEEYISNSNRKKFYDEVKSTTIDDYKPNGSKKVDLLMTIPLLKRIASHNEEFNKDLNEYLELIEYNEEELKRELDIKIKEELNKCH